MRLEVAPAGERREWLRGVTDALARGLADVAAEAPGEIELRIERAER
jgi:hypothetical protein